VLCNGEVVETKTVAIPSTAPGATASLSFSLATAMEQGNEYALNVELLKKEAEDWCEAGYPMASEQFVLQERGALKSVAQVNETLTVNKNNGVSVSNSNITFVVNANGFVTEWVANGVIVVAIALCLA
jgi:beta-galactosidase/beta-glucuronidase